MKLFGTAGIRGDVTDIVTPELALTIGRAVGLEAVNRGVDGVVLGRDGRVTGRTIAAAVVAGLGSAGVVVNRTGMIPTPGLAFSSRGRIGVMLTASHNPPSDNGIKLFADGVEFDRSAEHRIESLVEKEPDSVEWTQWKGERKITPLDDYRSEVISFAREQALSLSGLRVAVDCGNGMAALSAPTVLESLGATVSALNSNIDGWFPARESKPTAQSLVDLRSFVADGPADVGFGFDGDADRIVVVDSAGEVVHEDTVVAVLAEHYVRGSDSTNPLVVTTPNASARIDERVQALGGEIKRVALGSIAEGIADARSGGENVAFAAEPWKHIHRPLGDWIDAVASAVVFGGLVAEQGGIKPLTSNISEWPYRKNQVPCPDATKSTVMDRLETVLPNQFPDAETSFKYGIRLDFPNTAWILVRPSGTEPYIRVYTEGDMADTLLDDTIAIVTNQVGQSNDNECES